MNRTIEGIYEKGKITLREKPVVKKAAITVTFFDDSEKLKLFTRMPGIFLQPIKVRRIKKPSREELHER